MDVMVIEVQQHMNMAGSWLGVIHPQIVDIPKNKIPK